MPLPEQTTSPPPAPTPTHGACEARRHVAFGGSVVVAMDRRGSRRCPIPIWIPAANAFSVRAKDESVLHSNQQDPRSKTEAQRGSGLEKRVRSEHLTKEGESGKSRDHPWTTNGPRKADATEETGREVGKEGTRGGTGGEGKGGWVALGPTAAVLAAPSTEPRPRKRARARRVTKGAPYRTLPPPHSSADPLGTSVACAPPRAPQQSPGEQQCWPPEGPRAPLGASW